MPPNVSPSDVIPDPPFPLPPGVELRNTPTCGRGLFVTRAFRSGEVVIPHTDPLWVTLSLTSVIRGLQSENLDPLAALVASYRALPAATRAHLSLLYSGAAVDSDAFADSIESSKLLVPSGQALHFSEIFPLIAPELAKRGICANEALAALSIAGYNAFGSGAGCFVFGSISLANHTCVVPPPCEISATGSAYASIRTTVDLAPGDEVLIGYTGCTIASVHGRRAILSTTKGFFCHCTRCTTGLDITGGVPCPKCSPPRPHGRVSYAENTGLAALATAYRDLSVDPIAATKWFCPTCEARFDDSDFGAIEPPQVVEVYAHSKKKAYRFSSVADFIRRHEIWAAGELLEVQNLDGQAGDLRGGFGYHRTEPVNALLSPRVFGFQHWAAFGEMCIQPMLRISRAKDEKALEKVLNRVMASRAWGTGYHQVLNRAGVGHLYDITQDGGLLDLQKNAIRQAIIQVPAVMRNNYVLNACLQLDQSIPAQFQDVTSSTITALMDDVKGLALTELQMIERGL